MADHGNLVTIFKSMPSPPRILAIESSCDETACAIVTGSYVEASIVASQIAVHAPYGGVVPELASRHHLTSIVPVVQQAMQQAGIEQLAQLDAIAVTEGPGLVGALLVGIQMARGLAAAGKLPLYGIHHLEGHLFSTLLADSQNPSSEAFTPHLALLVSGGHTELVHVQGLARYRVIGKTRDDAAGEAYDKVAKMLGLGYPGGPIIDRLAAQGDPHAYPFPRSMTQDKRNFEFSFSGLKTAVMVHIERYGYPQTERERANLCASFQAAVVDTLVTKVRRARQALACDRVHVSGGVSANQGLRHALQLAAQEEPFLLRVPELRYCGDNAAMIAAAAAARMQAQLPSCLYVHASRSIEVQEAHCS